jgi:hypothetical protein
MSKHKAAKRGINFSSHTIASTWPCPKNNNLPDAQKNNMTAALEIEQIR